LLYVLAILLVAVAVIAYFYFFRVLPLRQFARSVASLYLGDNDQCLVIFNDKNYQYLEKQELKKYFEQIGEDLKGGYWMVLLVDETGYVYKPDKSKKEYVNNFIKSLGISKHHIHWREDKKEYIKGIKKD
jgi:hypothetical protein